MKHYGVETSECLEGPADPIKSRERSSKKIRFPITETSKFSAARKVVGETRKEVILRRTLAFGSQYGIVVFCLTEAGEQQIGWVTEKDPWNFAVGKAYDLPNYHAKIDSVSAKNMGGKFTNITIFIICGALWNN